MCVSRYCKWRWLLFHRAWTDTRADRMPSWSRLYLRIFGKLLTTSLLVALAPLAPLAVLAVVLGPDAVWRALLASPEADLLMAMFMLGLPAAIAYRWARPIWIDLVMIRQRAKNLAAGRFRDQATESYSTILGPLARMLNTLAEQMEQLIAVQRELASGISHELRTPMARARFALELLRDPASGDEYEDALTSIDQDIAELDEMIDMSLTYARLEYRSLQSVLEATPLVPWFDDELADAILLYADKEILTNVEVDMSTQVVMDRRLMSYAIRNLLRNAARHARARILVGLRLCDGDVEFFVEDDGPGVPESERERVFGAFVRLDRSIGGYGLGLAISRQALHAHHGRIRATQPMLLSGARFEINWPIGTI